MLELKAVLHSPKARNLKRYFLILVINDSSRIHLTSVYNSYSETSPDSVNRYTEPTIKIRLET
jgi:hypothetical protein